MSEEKNGTAENEYMHESLEKDAVKYDMPADEIIQALASDNKNLQSTITALESKNKRLIKLLRRR